MSSLFPAVLVLSLVIAARPAFAVKQVFSAKECAAKCQSVISEIPSRPCSPSSKWSLPDPQKSCTSTCASKKTNGTPPLSITQTCVSSGMQRGLGYSFSR